MNHSNTSHQSFENDTEFDTKLKDVVDSVQNDPTISDEDKGKFLRNFNRLKRNKLNLMIVGGTGTGKSSTINALFDTDIAKVGKGSDPETMSINCYVLDNNLILWDTPGLGDGKEADQRHTKIIINKLHEKDSKGDLLIDMVLVIVDGSSRDLGTTYQLINDIIIPNLGEDKHRILVAINKADKAMDDCWDLTDNKPEPELVEFLEDKVISTKERIKEATGVDVDVIYYSAGNGAKRKPYNLSKLLAFIVRHTKKKKRFLIANKVNQNDENWSSGQESIKFIEETKKSFWESLVDNFADGVNASAKIAKKAAKALGVVGSVVSEYWKRFF
ncbi:MAG: GTPase family protein [Moraxella sp.]